MDTGRVDRTGPAPRDDPGAASGDSAGTPALTGIDAEELGALGRVLGARVGLELPDRELIRTASLILDGMRDEGFDVVNLYPEGGSYTMEAVADLDD